MSSPSAVSSRRPIDLFINKIQEGTTRWKVSLIASLFFCFIAVCGVGISCIYIPQSSLAPYSSYFFYPFMTGAIIAATSAIISAYKLRTAATTVVRKIKSKKLEGHPSIHKYIIKLDFSAFQEKSSESFKNRVLRNQAGKKKMIERTLLAPTSNEKKIRYEKVQLDQNQFNRDLKIQMDKTNSSLTCLSEPYEYTKPSKPYLFTLNGDVELNTTSKDKATYEFPLFSKIYFALEEHQELFSDESPTVFFFPKLERRFAIKGDSSKSLFKKERSRQDLVCIDSRNGFPSCEEGYMKMFKYWLSRFYLAFATVRDSGKNIIHTFIPNCELTEKEILTLQFLAGKMANIYVSAHGCSNIRLNREIRDELRDKNTPQDVLDALAKRRMNEKRAEQRQLNKRKKWSFDSATGRHKKEHSASNY